MRRVVSVWFPHWPTDRLRRGLPPSERLEHTPLVTALHDGRRRVVAALDPAAATAGLRAGMAVAQALAIVPGLQVVEGEPDRDAAALRRLAQWCHRVTPLASVDLPDGLWLDVTGCAHLFGGEAGLLDGVLARFARDGLQAQAAVADTPGAAHAMARHACKAVPIRHAGRIVPPGEQAAALAGLPVGCLRLAPALEATLRRLGFELVSHLTRVPRALLARRFGPLPGLRLDQANGLLHEPLAPLVPETLMQRREAFLEPLLTAEALGVGIDRLAGPLCAQLEQAGLGARQLDLLFERVDGQVWAIRIGTARPSRDAVHLGRLLREQLETVDPGLGVEAMRLVAVLVETLQWEQQDDGAAREVGRLLDRLGSRLGGERVHQAKPRESAIPERSVEQAAPDARMDADMEGIAAPAAVEAPAIEPSAVRPALQIVTRTPHGDAQRRGPVPVRHLTLVDHPVAAARSTISREDETGGTEAPELPWCPPGRRPWATARREAGKVSSWPSRLERPARLLEPPRPIEALAALPNGPPIAFTWRRRRYRVCRSDGPERIRGEWWRRDEEAVAVRDYFRIEDDTGQRFWLFRRGDAIDPRTGDLSWFIHGLF